MTDFHIGETIKKVATDRKIDVKLIAEKLGFSTMNIYKMFSNRHIGTENMFKIADALDLNKDALKTYITNFFLSGEVIEPKVKDDKIDSNVLGYLMEQNKKLTDLLSKLSENAS